MMQRYHVTTVHSLCHLMNDLNQIVRVLNVGLNISTVTIKRAKIFLIRLLFVLSETF